MQQTYGQQEPIFRYLKLPSPFTEADIARSFREKAHQLHPDHGGDNDSLRKLLDEREQAIRWLHAPKQDPQQDQRPTIEEWFGEYVPWSISRKGNPWVRIHGFSATVFPYGSGYKFVVNRTDDKACFGRPIVRSIDEAKRLALLTIQLMEMECPGDAWH